MRIHGNYCGPNWSAGREQSSVESSVPAVDDFDSTCKEHDAAYAIRKNMTQADNNFFHQNFGKGLVRTGAAIAVGAFGRFYHPQSDISDQENQYQAMNITDLIQQNKLRGAAPQPLTIDELPTYIYDVDQLPANGSFYDPYNPPSRSSTTIGANDEHIYRNKSTRSSGSEFNDIQPYNYPRNQNSLMDLLLYRATPKRRNAITTNKRKRKLQRLYEILSPKMKSRDFWESLNSVNNLNTRRALFDQ